MIAANSSGSSGTFPWFEFTTTRLKSQPSAAAEVTAGFAAVLRVPAVTDAAIGACAHIELHAASPSSRLYLMRGSGVGRRGADGAAVTLGDSKHGAHVGRSSAAGLTAKPGGVEIFPAAVPSVGGSSLIIMARFGGTPISIIARWSRGVRGSASSSFFRHASFWMQLQVLGEGDAPGLLLLAHRVGNPPAAAPGENSSLIGSSAG